MTPVSEQLAREVAALCPTVIVSFSRGKDSIAAWLHVRRFFERIEAFHLALIPGLSFEEESLDYFERKFGAKIHRYPHPSLFRMLRNFVFQSPDRCSRIEALNLKRWTYQQIENDFREKADAPGAYIAIGARTADSPTRLANIRRYGAINRKRRSFQAVHDWRIAHVKQAITEANIKLPVDYLM